MSTRVPAAPNRAPAAPRRVPRQARSRATVAILVEAGARVLGALGSDEFTTNRVAETAGVSIGSLYQYFPDKTALLAAIRERHLAECRAALDAARQSDLSGMPLARLLVGGMIAVHAASPGLHRVLIEGPADGGALFDPESAYERDYLAGYADLVRRLAGSDRAEAVETLARVVSDAVDGVIHNAVRRGTIGRPELEVELAWLILAYVGGAPCARPVLS